MTQLLAVLNEKAIASLTALIIGVLLITGVAALFKKGKVERAIGAARTAKGKSNKKVKTFATVWFVLKFIFIALALMGLGYVLITLLRV